MANETFKQGDYVTIDGKVYIFNKYISSKLCRVYFTPAMKRKGERVGDDFLKDLYESKNLRFSSVADLINNKITINPKTGDIIKFIDPYSSVSSIRILNTISVREQKCSLTWMRESHEIIHVNRDYGMYSIYIKSPTNETWELDHRHIRIVNSNNNNEETMYDFSLLLKKIKNS